MSSPLEHYPLVLTVISAEDVHSTFLEYIVSYKIEEF